MNLIALRNLALSVALGQVGVRETGGNNAGEQVEGYLAAVGLGPGHPWCCAFVVWCYRTAARALGQKSPLPVTGRCVRLWQRAPRLWRTDSPCVGAIYIHLVEPDDPDSDGHAGIVESFSDTVIRAVEGNTNAVGSRIGTQVRLNTRRRSYVHGFIDVGLEGPLEVPRVT